MSVSGGSIGFNRVSEGLVREFDIKNAGRSSMEIRVESSHGLDANEEWRDTEDMPVKLYVPVCSSRKSVSSSNVWNAPRRSLGLTKWPAFGRNFWRDNRVLARRLFRESSMIDYTGKSKVRRFSKSLLQSSIPRGENPVYHQFSGRSFIKEVGADDAEISLSGAKHSALLELYGFKLSNYGSA